jgi:DNA mismatch repair protein MutS2
MTLFEKSQKILELPAVLEMLAAEAVGEAAKASAAALTPASDPAEMERRLDETSAACDMMTLNGSPSFAGVKNVTGSLRRAGAGGMLNTTELLEIAAVLRSARGAIAYASGSKAEKCAISYLFSSLRANRYLEDKITNSIVGEDELADTASPALGDIRRSMRAAGERVRQTLQRIISSPSYSKSLQEPIITVKNGRYVVPVKAEHKNDVPGLTHDVSSSGATLFIEPMSAVKANNEIRELLAKEEKEIDRILMEMSAEASSFEEDIVCDFNVLTQLDLVFAKARLSYKMEASRPEIAKNGEIILKKARHPLLKAGTAVPINVTLGGAFDTLVITGPNTGGKTVSLKTIGLLCLMAECGLHIPADSGSAVPNFGKVLADIGDEQSIEQSLSTFSSHMKNIVGILEECGEDSLVLFDELGAGTDPAEGAALAVAIIEYARKCGAKIAATTHYAELKIYAMTEKGVMNASCEFDVQTLKPTYRLLIGVPGKSNAFAISKRLGLPEEIIGDASSRMDAGDKDFEDALTTLEAARREAEDKSAETARLMRRAQDDAKAAEKLRGESEAEREKAAKTARREAEQIIFQARAAAEDAMKEIERIRRESESGDWQRLNEAKSAVRRSLNEAEDRILPGGAGEEERPEPTRPAKAGDVVEILSIGTRAEVISASPTARWSSRQG